MDEQELVLKLIKITGKENDSKVFLDSFKSIEKTQFALIYISPNSLFQSIQNILLDIGFLHSLDLYPSILISKETRDYLELFFKKQFSEEIDFEIIEYQNQKIDLASLIQNKKIPFLVLQNETEIFTEIKNIQNKFHFKKIIYLDNEAPFLNHENEIISILHTNKEYEEKNLLPVDLDFYIQIKSLIKETNSEFVYTAPTTLLKELFTIKGAGSLIKKGADLEMYSSFQELNIIQLKEVLEKSFKKKIKESFFDKNIESIILEKNYKAGAIFFKTEFGIYLSKFLVDEIARGEGLGREIWDLMKENYKQIFWRAKKENPIKSWYLKECDGFYKSEKWNLYFIGIQLESFQAIEKYINSLEEDFL